MARLRGLPPLCPCLLRRSTRRQEQALEPHLEKNCLLLRTPVQALCTWGPKLYVVSHYGFVWFLINYLNWAIPAFSPPRYSVPGDSDPQQIARTGSRPVHSEKTTETHLKIPELATRKSLTVCQLRSWGEE